MPAESESLGYHCTYYIKQRDPETIRTSEVNQNENTNMLEDDIPLHQYDLRTEKLVTISQINVS